MISRFSNISIVITVIIVFSFSIYGLWKEKIKVASIQEEQEEIAEKMPKLKEVVEAPEEPITPRDELIPIEIVISPEVSKRLAELGWNDDGAREVAKRARASVVCFLKTIESGSCSATGFVTTGGLIATCGHCPPHIHNDETGETTDLKQFRIKTITGEIMDAEVVEKSDIADLALVKVTSNMSALPPPLLPEVRLVKSEPVISVGHPSLTGNWTITLGKVELLQLDAEGIGWNFFDISEAPGSSGSPLVNKNGEVIGVESGGSAPDFNFRLNLIQKLTKTLKELFEILFHYKGIPAPSPPNLTFQLNPRTSATGESIIILQDMINRHQKEWIQVPDSATYVYMEKRASPLPQTSTHKSNAERFQELDWSEVEARALTKKVRASTICLQPPSELDHCISSWVAAPGIIATCAHCVHSHGKDGDVLVARTISNDILRVELLEKSDKADWAIFKVTSNASALPQPLPLGSASTGDPILMVGHPGRSTWVTVLGEVHTVDEKTGYSADLSYFGGNSGSAVVNRYGEVIGVATGGSWEGGHPQELYPPHIILNIYKARTDFATIDSTSFLVPMLEKYR